jgi:S-layer homology domain
MRRSFQVTLALVAFLASARSLNAQAGSGAGEPVLAAVEHELRAPEWGTVGRSAVVKSALDFVPPDSSITYGDFNAGGVFRFQTSAVAFDWWGGVDLPNGAIIDRVEFHACDTTATGRFVFGLARFTLPGQGGANVTPTGSTGLPETPGCAVFSLLPSAPPVVVNSATETYAFFFTFQGDFSTAIKAGSMRVVYRLQVSPIPLTETFSDVPVGHPQHRFVEALAAAGITGGCGGGLYCPDASLTRGQMAVFLAVALGLHFPY